MLTAVTVASTILSILYVRFIEARIRFGEAASKAFNSLCEIPTENERAKRKHGAALSILYVRFGYEPTRCGG